MTSYQQPGLSQEDQPLELIPVGEEQHFLMSTCEKTLTLTERNRLLDLAAIRMHSRNDILGLLLREKADAMWHSASALKENYWKHWKS